MDRGQRFISAIAVFVAISFIIMFLIKNVLLQAVLMLILFIALLKVLYDVARPSRTKDACQTTLVHEFEVEMDGKSRQKIVPSKKRRKAKK